VDGAGRRTEPMPELGSVTEYVVGQLPSWGVSGAELEAMTAALRFRAAPGGRSRSAVPRTALDVAAEAALDVLPALYLLAFEGGPDLGAELDAAVRLAWSLARRQLRRGGPVPR
jgi:plasmid stability protein